MAKNATGGERFAPKSAAGRPDAKAFLVRTVGTSLTEVGIASFRTAAEDAVWRPKAASELYASWQELDRTVAIAQELQGRVGAMLSNFERSESYRQQFDRFMFPDRPPKREGPKLAPTRDLVAALQCFVARFTHPDVEAERSGMLLANDRGRPAHVIEYRARVHVLGDWLLKVSTHEPKLTPTWPSLLAHLEIAAGGRPPCKTSKSWRSRREVWRNFLYPTTGYPLGEELRGKLAALLPSSPEEIAAFEQAMDELANEWESEEGQPPKNPPAA